MDRTVPFEKDEICDYCGEKGAFDFFGDLICPECAATIFSDSDESKPE